jgi:UDP-glucuronate 4-epimerase
MNKRSSSARRVILITGTAGFIGFHTARYFLERGDAVIGIDNFNPYYDRRMKERRNDILEEYPAFKLHRISIADYTALKKVFKKEKPDKVIHLAAQAGVRYSLKNPWAYADSNYVGTLNLFQAAHECGIKTVIYASSSSVYGDNEKTPFAEDDRTDTPISTYAASKKANELLAYSFHHLYGMNMIGLRFFTVYGDYYRLDMALFKFAKKILTGETITLFNNGDMKREFTHVDDVVRGIAQAIDKDIAGYELYNLGGGETVKLNRFVSLIEEHLGTKAKIKLAPLQAGDLKDTIADISKARRDLGFEAKVTIEEGIERFCSWFLENKAWLLKLKDADN